MMRLQKVFGILFLLHCPGFAISQKTALPKLFPSHITAYDLEDGMPASCAWDGLMDKKGRLWVSSCFAQIEHQTISFYQFDGHESAIINWPDLPEGAISQATLAGITRAGELFGFFRQTGHFFFFDPETRRARFYKLDQEDAAIFYMQHSEKYGLIIRAASPDRQFYYRMQGKTPELLLELPYGVRNWGSVYNYYLSHYQVLIGDSFWSIELPMNQPNPEGTGEQQPITLLEYNLQDKTYREYAYDELFPGGPASAIPQQIILAASSDNRLLLLTNFCLYSLDPKTKKPVVVQGFPFNKNYNWFHPLDYRVQRDAVGNLLFVLPVDQHTHCAVLLDTAGQYYDYTEVFRAANTRSRYPDLYPKNVYSTDFRRSLLAFHSGGIIAVDLQFFGSIATCLEAYPTRAIAEWRARQYLVKAEGMPNLLLIRPAQSPSTSQLTAFPEENDKFKSAGLANIVQANGAWWYCTDTDLMRIDSAKTCVRFPVGIEFRIFALLDSQTVMLLSRGGQVYRYDLTMKKCSAWLEDGKPLHLKTEPNQIFRSHDGTLWIASLKGLWKLDLGSGRSRCYGREQGFRDDRIMCINEDDRGQLWLGTYSGGIHIFDPVSEKIQVVDREKGLSNNTVIGLLPDDRGMWWASTYNGLNLISPRGAALAQLYRQDGLSADEFNRFSCMKDSDGRLLFGSIHGINIIEPESIKKQIYLAKNLRIYLTGITRYDVGKGADSTQLYGFERMATLKLPASHRYLDLRFALSSFIRPDDQRFAYKIEKDGAATSADWIFLGNQHHLYLPDIPAGRYNIWIRGSDYRGNWVQAPIAISIEAGAFFYQRRWFYLLCFLVFAGATFAWIYRQRILRKQLEQELAERSAEIMAARDQLILQEKLASLGQMVAGIAHEIKNPLNFINNFSEGSREVLDELVRELEKPRDPESGEGLPEKAMFYLNMLKQNIEIIHRHGSRMNDTVSGMMNHARDSSGERLEIDINHLVESNINLAYHGFKGNNADFNADIQRVYDASGPILAVFPNDLGRCLLNLLDNACYAVHERGQTAPSSYQPCIKVTTISYPASLDIRIWDNGPGIPGEIREKIFTPFFTTKPTRKGNIGLGLSICQDIVVQGHKGEITVISEEGVFTEFCIRLPAGGMA